MEVRPEPVGKLIKLVDACNRCGLAFRMAAEHVGDDGFQDFFSQLRRTLDRFGYELQTEIRRIDGGNIGAPRSYSDEACESLLMMNRCGTAMRSAVDEYTAVQDEAMPAHARAMVHRQNEVLRQFEVQFENLKLRECDTRHPQKSLHP